MSATGTQPKQYGDSHSLEFIPAAVLEEMFPARKEAPGAPAPDVFTD